MKHTSLSALDQQVCEHLHYENRDRSGIFKQCQDCGYVYYPHYKERYLQTIDGNQTSIKMIWIEVDQTEKNAIPSFWMSESVLTSYQYFELLSHEQLQNRSMFAYVAEMSREEYFMLNVVAYSKPHQDVYYFISAEEYVKDLPIILQQSQCVLPTLHEWRIACSTYSEQYICGEQHFGSLQMHPLYDQLPGQPQNYISELYGTNTATGKHYTNRVKTVLPNSYGLYDMLGYCTEVCITENTEAHHLVKYSSGDVVTELVDFADTEYDNVFGIRLVQHV